MTTITTPPTMPQREPARRTSRQPKLWGLMAEFDTPAAIMHAAERTRAEGFRWFDCHVPFPVHGLDKVMGIKPTWLPFFVFGGGLTGCIIGTLLQYLTNSISINLWLLVWFRGYDFMISGKPFASVPAWIPVVFELTVLVAAFAAVGMMLLFNGLPQLYHPTLKHPKFWRATDDRFFLVIESRDPKFMKERTEAFMASLDPLSIEELEA
jgi:hypothetical protein